MLQIGAMMSVPETSPVVAVHPNEVPDECVFQPGFTVVARGSLLYLSLSYEGYTNQQHLYHT